MSNSAYCGINGSGKSFEVVRSVIIPAIKSGRRVVTNIDGIDSDAVRAYCVDKFDVSLENCGHIVKFHIDDILKPSFFPVSDSDSALSFVVGGDLVVVDECYRVWGTDKKILPEHMIFFREHRHYVNALTGATCDLVMITQSVNDLHRVVRVVLEISFSMHKAKGIGRSDLYTVTMWEGYKQTQKGIVKTWTQTYDKEIFPLYKSYSGGVVGSESSTDSRHNIFSDKSFVIKIILFVVLSIFCVWKIYHFFADRINAESSTPTTSSPTSSTIPPVAPVSDLSPDWRISGFINVGGVDKIVLTGSHGILIEDSNQYKGSGFSLSGRVDGRRVTRFSGPALSSESNNKNAQK